MNLNKKLTYRHLLFLIGLPITFLMIRNMVLYNDNPTAGMFAFFVFLIALFLYLFKFIKKVI